MNKMNKMRIIRTFSAKVMSTIGKVKSPLFRASIHQFPFPSPQQILFFIYEIFVSLMQFNLLIAMMTRTYEMIYATQKEWKRQV
jgi:hypothetical protein